MPDAVLVIDMVRGFFEEGYPLYLGEKARRIIPGIKRLLQQEVDKGSMVFFLCDSHAPDDPEFAMFSPHCVAGTVEAEVIPELAHFARSPGEVIHKTRFSCFLETELEEKLKAFAPDKLIVCGVVTDICVLHTVFDARGRDYQVEVPVDCVASFDERAHHFALEHMEKVLGARLVGTQEELKGKKAVFKPSDAILSGETADIYFARTVDVLCQEGLNPVATMEVFPSKGGVLCGIKEVKALLHRVLPQGSEVWALAEGETFQGKEVVLRITAPYQSYGLYETTILGILSHCSGWATAARECVNASHGTPVISFGVRHVHPSVAGVMDYSAIVGGCTACSSVAGAKIADIEPSGTMPHALILIMGDTIRATIAFDEHMPPEVPRISLVDTFRDEVEESVAVARALGGRLKGVRLDTPSERGGVTADLVREVRAHLDLAGFKEVSIFVSGGVDLERIRKFHENGAPVDGFGVGSYISGASPIDFTADLHEIEGKPVAKRGRLPGITPNPRLTRVL